jgi:hypothetical protein
MYWTATQAALTLPKHASNQWSLLRNPGGGSPGLDKATSIARIIGEEANHENAAAYFL